MTAHGMAAGHGAGRAALIAAFALALAASAWAQGINVTIKNDTSNNLRVTVFDENGANPHGIVSNDVINGFASITVLVSADASGLGHISWSATTVREDMRRCAHRDKSGLNDGDTVHVFANQRCGAGF